ncbi:hypothetical protein L873DRAFT_644412 [Choiromyces venosus 120613-1]|uniref:Uncharacterized protein n=1 Tax=Choiromyces venosus 120613-1 TaxID=1336337 RepID=A0A3N4JTI2_9PEZI|nr:hypothetical protein L873DRAFT_644412 [Choiromyces venosus 120613-1]
MESSAAFLDLVFSESLGEHTIKKAHELLILRPYQLFDLLLKEERFTNFFARIELYGNNLANLLDQFPRFEEHDYGALLLGEIIRSFTLSLLSERFNDMKSRTAVARIVLSVVKLSDPAALGRFGVRLGALPGILQILFAEGPGSNIESNVFEHLLGDHLGEWKIIMSQQAMEDLAKEKSRDHIENIRRKFYKLASGDWAGQNHMLNRAQWNNGRSYRIPVFKAFYATGRFILWQIDAAFDERFGNDYQVIKVWAIGKPEKGEIHRAQQIYTKAHVKACSRDGLDGSRDTRYPEMVYLDEKKDGVEVDEIEDGGFDDLAQLVLWSQCNCSG